MVNMAILKIVTGPVTPRIHKGCPPKMAKQQPVTLVARITCVGKTRQSQSDCSEKEY